MAITALMTRGHGAYTTFVRAATPRQRAFAHPTAVRPPRSLANTSQAPANPASATANNA
jgi:hypothetical protein